MPSALRGQKRIWDLLKLELQRVVGCQARCHREVTLYRCEHIYIHLRPQPSASAESSPTPWAALLSSRGAEDSAGPTVPACASFPAAPSSNYFLHLIGRTTCFLGHMPPMLMPVFDQSYFNLKNIFAIRLAKTKQINDPQNQTKTKTMVIVTDLGWL